MPILDPAEWKKRTKRGLFSPRSTELETLDRALNDYHLHPSTTTLNALNKAVGDWQKAKGKNWSNSTRNTDGAVDELIAAISAKMGGGGTGMGAIAKMAATTVLTAPPPVAVYPTMTDDKLVSQFATHAKTCFKNHWNKAQPVTTGRKLMDGIIAVHASCGVPRVGIEIKALAPGYEGFFDFPNWRIQLNTATFSTYDMVYTNPPTNAKPHGYFVGLAETFYHEARHCEQWWHMARYYAHGKTAAEVSTTLGIPLGIATEACARPMKHGDPMIKLTKGWYDSVYGGSNRGVVLHALALKREANPSPKILPGEKGGGEIYSAYSGKLPEEIDAWAIQDLLRAKF